MAAIVTCSTNPPIKGHWAQTGRRCDLESDMRGNWRSHPSDSEMEKSPLTCTMSESMQQVCTLCQRADADPGICGSTLEIEEICVHEFCLYFANELSDRRAENPECLAFDVVDIRREIEKAAQKHCFVCGQRGATITCWETGCDRNFHLPCAGEGECVTQYLAPFRAFCWEHGPQQAVEATPEENDICLICLEPVGERQTYGTLVCPACKHAWFHRSCIQAHAINNGCTCFQCPNCRDEDLFELEMRIVGIPLRLPLWDAEAFAEVNARQSHCGARECLCPGGREQVEEEGPWQLLLCSSCAAKGTHRHCSGLRNRTSWECNCCAGLGNGSSITTEPGSPSLPSQEPPGASRSSPAPESSGRSSTPGPMQLPDGSCSLLSTESISPSQAAPGPAHSSPAPQTNGPSAPHQLPSRASRRAGPRSVLCVLV